MPTICFYCVICGTALHASSESADDLMQCRSCSRHVPVPRLSSLLGKGREYLPVFPPEVLELTVKFHCTKCGSRLGADARWEGRGMACPDCGAGIRIPRWSMGPGWARVAAADSRVPMPPTRSAADLEAATLSNEEIAFLSAPDSEKPGAVT